MLAAIGLGAAVAFATGLALDGSSRTAGMSAAIVAVASLVSLLPGLLQLRAENWGLAVLGASMARVLLVIAIGFAAGPAGDRRAFWLGLVAGAVVVLIAETSLAISALQRMERTKRMPAGGLAGGGERVQA